MNTLIKILSNKLLRNILFLLALAGTFYLLWKSNKQLQSDNKRLSADMQSLSTGVKEIKLQSGKMAVQSDVLMLRTNELKKLFPDQAKSIENIGVKASRTIQVGKTVIETQKNIITLLRDSFVHDTIQVKVFSYSDQFYQISGVSQGDSQHLQIHSTDTLVQAVFKGERVNPWLWIFSPRKLQQRVSLSNPNATIKYSQLIQIQSHE